MSIELNFFGPLRDVVGAKTLNREVSGSTTIGELLVELATEFPSLENHHVDRSGEIPRELNVTVNGRNVRLLDGSETSLNEGDIVRLAPPVSGG